MRDLLEIRNEIDELDDKQRKSQNIKLRLVNKSSTRREKIPNFIC